MKTLHLHIGSQKTGTTSIQKTFHNNRNKLAGQGFLYPGNTFNHHQFYFATRSDEKDWPRQFKGYNRQDLRIGINNYFEILEKGLASDFSRQIISTEYLFIANSEYIRNVCDFLHSFFSDIKVYVFVRNPVGYYRSVQQQKIKACSYITAPGIFFYNFKDVIQTWSRFCPVEVIEYKQESDSCKVLCEKIGLKFQELSHCTYPRNSSLSTEQMLLLEKIQRDLYPDSNDRFKNHLGIIQTIQPDSATKPKLKECVQNLIYRNHQKDSEWLKSTYGIDYLSGFAMTDKRFVPTPVLKDGRAAIADVYQIRDYTAFEKYESLVMDFLLRKVTETRK